MLKMPQGEEVPAIEISSKTRTNFPFPKKIPAIVSFVGEGFAFELFEGRLFSEMLVVEVMFPEASGIEEELAGVD